MTGAGVCVCLYLECVCKLLFQINKTQNNKKTNKIQRGNSQKRRMDDHEMSSTVSIDHGNTNYNENHPSTYLPTHLPTFVQQPGKKYER